MDERHQLSDEKLCLIEKVDKRAADFERALRQGTDKTIEQVIGDSPQEERELLFVELLSAELEFHLTRGEKSVDLDLYIRRFPKYREEIIDVYRQTLDRLAGPPAHRSYLGRASAVAASFCDDDLPRPFGRYQLLRLLGSGEMGHVYLGLDGRLNRKVAIKIPRFSDAAALEWFRHEAQVMASLRHANLCPVFDWGVHEDQHYLCMAYIAGETLADHIQDGAHLSQLKAADLVRRLAGALSVVHEAGTIHRDVKPANVMIDERGEPMLMDFGLVRSSDDRASEPTRARTIVGSPAFMPPEQAAGRESEIGPTSDVYSLGVILYQMLTGHLPFEGDSASVLKQIASVPVPAISKSSPDVDCLLEEICLKALAKDRDGRYRNAAEFAKALDEYIESNRRLSSATETQALVPATNEPATVPQRRFGNGWALGTLLTVLLLLVLGIVFQKEILARLASRKAPTVEDPIQPTPIRSAATRSEKLPPLPKATARSTGEFYDSGQRLSLSTTSQVELLDLDGDRDLDAICRAYQGPLTVWFNDGAGRFTDSNQKIGRIGKGFACGDLDGDGDYDLVNAMDTRAAGVFLNNGRGYFEDTGKRLEWVNEGITLEDFDNDQDLDLFSAPLEGEQHVWLNDGQGNFVRFGNSLSQTIVGKAMAGDLDNDGDQDLFLAVNSQDRNRVYFNDGSGRFSDSLQPLTSSMGRDCDLADYDRDGDLDAFVTNSRWYCQLWENDGSGHFTQIDLFPFKGLGATIRFNDFEGDGTQELLLTHFRNQAAVIARNQGKPNLFSDRRWFPHFLSAVCNVGDLDGDGDLDVYFGTEGPDQVWLNRNLDEESSLQTRLPFVDERFAASKQSLGHSNSTVLADFDMDGDVDAYLCNEGQDSMLWNDGEGNFRASPLDTENSATRHGAVADFDGNRFPDLIVVSATNDRACRLLWNDEGQLIEPAAPLLTGNTSGVDLGDLDGDGDLDAVISIYNGPSRILFNEGHGQFRMSEAELTMVRTMAVGLCDLDADGHLDAFFTNEGAPDQVWLNDGLGNFRQVDQELGKGRGAAVTFGDIDSDGDVDAVVANINGVDDRWLNDGTAHFQLATPAQGGFSSYDVELVDLDGDESLDLVTSGEGGPSGISWNHGDGQFDRSVTWLGEFELSTCATADFDGDGLLDIFLSSKGSRENVVFLNSPTQ